MELERPLPQPITPEPKPYWDGLREQKLMLPRCRACQRAFLYPRVLCPFCHASDIEWVQASGRGKLYSFEIAYQTISKVFKVKPPYVLAMIELEEGPRMMSNLVGIEPDPKRIACDMPVEVVFEKLTDERDELGTLPHKSMLTLHLEAVRNAVRDAGLKIGDVDGVFTAGQHSPATIGEGVGIVPRYVDGTTVGGCSFIIMVGHAMVALHHGLCDVAVVCHGE